MTFDRDPRRNPNPNQRATRSNLLPLIVAAAIAVVLVVMMFPRTTPERLGETNAAPSVQTATPSPTTEPRPTQAPQP